MNDFDDEELKSKSQIKREMTALTRFGEELVNAGSARLAAFDLPDQLMRAIAEGEKIKAHGGRKRQIKYIGKLLRSVDDELIEAVRQEFNREGLEDKQREKRITHYRELLISEGDTALGEVLQQYPMADRQQLRQMTRKARQEAEQGKDLGAAKTLIRELRRLDEENEEYGL